MPLFVTDKLKFYSKALLKRYGQLQIFSRTKKRGRPRSPRLIGYIERLNLTCRQDNNRTGKNKFYSPAKRAELIDHIWPLSELLADSLLQNLNLLKGHGQRPKNF